MYLCANVLIELCSQISIEQNEEKLKKHKIFFQFCHTFHPLISNSKQVQLQNDHATYQF